MSDESFRPLDGGAVSQLADYTVQDGRHAVGVVCFLSFSHDAEHVCDAQRASHVRGDTAHLVLVCFGTQDGHRDVFR